MLFLDSLSHFILYSIYLEENVSHRYGPFNRGKCPDMDMMLETDINSLSNTCSLA